MKRTVFISHSSADKEIAEQICEYLEKHGVPCWIAPRDVTPGKNYGAAIIDAIDECRVFVLILSSESNKSRQVVREVERAASTDSVILPFRIQDVQPSRDIAFYVSAAHWLDAAKHPVQEQFDELLAAIQNWEKGDQTSDSAPVVPPPLPGSLAPPSATVPAAKRAFPAWVLLVIAAAVIAAGVAVFSQLRGTHQVATGAATASSTPDVSPSPAATATPASEPTATPTEAPTATPSSTAAPPASPTPAPIRLKPGERIHGLNSESSPVQSSAEATKGNVFTAGAKRPVIQEIAATSQFNTEYRPNYAFDGNPATGWSPRGRAIEQSLFVHFKAPVELQSISVLNGDGRDEEQYRSNGRVKTFRVILSDGTNQLFTFEDELKMQRFELKQPVTVSSVKFEIVSVTLGSKWKRTVISEIAFNEPKE